MEFTLKNTFLWKSTLAPFSLRWLKSYVFGGLSVGQQERGVRAQCLYAADFSFYPKSSQSALAWVCWPQGWHTGKVGTCRARTCALLEVCVTCLLPLSVPPSPCGVLGDMLTAEWDRVPWSVGSGHPGLLWKHRKAGTVPAVTLP